MSKNSEDYWRKREEEQRKHNIKDEQEFRKELEKMYRATLKEVNDQIYAFYAKYALQNAITMAEAKRRADKLDIEAYAEKAKRYVKEKNFSEQANKEMRIYNLTMKANRLELLKAEIGLELCANADEVDDFMREELEGRILNEIERQAGILGKSIQNNRKFAQALVNASFHNATFSDRIWANQALLRNELSNILTTALIQGRNPRDFISQVRKRFDVSTNNAYRLLVTELARVQTSAQMESFKRNGFDQYTFLALGTACEICRKIDGKHFDVDKANAGVNMPPMHPNCRCSTSAYMDDDEYNAWLDSYKDHGLTWDEWKTQSRGLAIRNGNIQGIETVNSTKVPYDMQKQIDNSLHRMFNKYPSLRNFINEVKFDEKMMDNEIAFSNINSSLKVTLKLNAKLFSSNKVLQNFLTNPPKELTEKKTLDDYLEHEFTHLKEFKYTIGTAKNDKEAYELISHDYYSNKILKEALDYCGLDKNDDILEREISAYAVYRASEAVAEACSGGNSKLCKRIQYLVKKEWGLG